MKLVQEAVNIVTETEDAARGAYHMRRKISVSFNQSEIMS
jgi:hypothetical protein